MDKVVDIEERLSRRRQGRQLEQYRAKIQSLQKVFHCTSCRFRCAMCGHHVGTEADSTPPEPGPLGYVFCEGCRNEFEDFLAISSGEKQAEVFWHNKAWLDMWSAWLNYQQAVSRFMHSPEFKILLSELQA